MAESLVCSFCRRPMLSPAERCSGSFLDVDHPPNAKPVTAARTLERACGCGRLYFADSLYDYSCPACFTDECHRAIRIIEWIGGMTPPGAMAVERTPLTDTLEAAIAFVCGPYSQMRYQPGGLIVPCLVARYRKAHTDALPLDYLDTADLIASHEPPALYIERDGRAFSPGGDGWWWMDTEVAWVPDRSELTCDKEDCCLDQPDV